MSGRLRILRILQNFKKHSKIFGAPAVMLGTATVGMKWNVWPSTGKDKLVFLPKEQNDIPSKANIKMGQLSENRVDPVLQNGELNWNCKCIETDVIGPCNTTFRPLAQFMHDNKIKEDLSNIDDGIKAEFDRLMEAYIACTMDYPVYYKHMLLPEELKDLDMEAEDFASRQQQKQQDMEANTRHYGKDTVVYLSAEENKIPSTVRVPKHEIEEFREPLNPDGTINWACGCIEKDVIGPCNVEFRAFRQFIHDSKGYKKDMPMEKQQELHNVIRTFLDCANEHPVYYESLLNFDKDIDSDIGKDNSGGVTSDNSGVTSDNSVLTSDNSGVTSDNSGVTSDNSDSKVETVP